MLRVLPGLVAGVVLAASAGAVVQSGQAPPPARDAVAVDFYLIGSDRRPITDLKPEEATVRIDGRPRKISALQLVTVASPPAADVAAPAIEVPPPPFATNTAAESGRTFILVFDDESIRPGRERPLRAAIGRFLGSLTPRDRVSLLTVPHGGMKVDLTNNHDRISEAFAQLTGHAPETETGSEGACRTRTVLESLEGMLNSLAGGSGPTTVIFISSSEYGPRRDAPATLAPGMCELTTRVFERMGAAAAPARAHFWVVQPDQVMVRGNAAGETIAGGNFSGSDNPLEGLEHIAGVTAAERLALATAGDATLVQIAHETTSYYSAVLETTAADLDGINRGLDVRIARSGVEVRARPHLFMPRPNTARPIAKTPSEMMKESRLSYDLPLRATAYAALGSGDGLTMKVVAVGEPTDPTVKLTAWSAALFDGQGRLTRQVSATPDQLTASPVTAAILVPPGTYRMRIAAVDATGRSGSVDTEVSAETTAAGALKLSSLVAGLSRNGGFVPKMQFSSEPVAIGFLEIYGGVAGAPVGAIVEVARTIDGPPIVTTRLAIEATADPTTFRASGAIPIGALPPGRLRGASARRHPGQAVRAGHQDDQKSGAVERRPRDGERSEPGARARGGGAPRATK